MLLNRAVLAVFLSCLNAAAASASTGRLEVLNGQFLVRISDGRTVAGDQLVGALLDLPTSKGIVKLKVESVVSVETSVGKRTLYHFLVKQSDSDTFQEVCQPDALGRSLGLPILKDGRIALTCTSGAEGKCILLGYIPWNNDRSVPYADLYQACIHMIRADYGGDGHASTEDGKVINVYDRYGIQRLSSREAMNFEAAWGPEGAVCVAHTRVPERRTLSELADRYPRLRGLLGPKACSEAAMQSRANALIFNLSPTGRRNHSRRNALQNKSGTAN